MIPGGGAVVQANYQTHIGSRVLFTLSDSHGPLPFGTSVRLRKAEDDRGAVPGGMVADGGQVYLSGIPQEGTLDAAWNADNISRRCALHFHLTDTVQQGQSPVKTVSGLCQ